RSQTQNRSQIVRLRGRKLYEPAAGKVLTDKETLRCQVPNSHVAVLSKPRSQSNLSRKRPAYCVAPTGRIGLCGSSRRMPLDHGCRDFAQAAPACCRCTTVELGRSVGAPFVAALPTARPLRPTDRRLAFAFPMLVVADAGSGQFRQPLSRLFV